MFRQAEIEGEPLRKELGAKLDAARACEPPRDAAMSLVIECWQTLASSRPAEIRPIGMGFATLRGEIPFHAIDAWARRLGLDDEHTLIVAEVIHQLDAERTERIHNELSTKG